MPWAALLSVAGFVLRVVSIYKDHDLGLFIAAVVLLLIAPSVSSKSSDVSKLKECRPVYSLMNYIVLSRTLYYVPYLSPIHPGRVLSTFIGLDAIVAVLTGNGASRVANMRATVTDLKVGRGLIRASILLQMACFVGFIALEATLHRRLVNARLLTSKLRTIIILLYASSAIIMVRNIYRVVDVWEGYTGYLEMHEAFFYVFDAAVMLANSVVLNVWHPSIYLPSDNKIYLARDGVTERQGPGWVDKRNFLLTIFDPFDIGGLIRRKDNKDKFWEEHGAPVNDMESSKAVA